ncbi:hypothetical protein [Streptomyces sp. t39]|uniref:hypothetical protein n=1 Tax=Streptomyces sp. t39 TaxID=1828156 RepID=UPI0011CEA2BB|nr:hypothetical protein [Streptomyces sp. t39]TXS42935.1 hypothetical protein EAO77_35350 [Streptomyces sp. t39]
MDAATRAWLIAQLGTATDLNDLDTRYTRLGNSRAVALEVLRERLAALLAQPSSISVSGVVSINNSEVIKALERQIAALEAGEPPAPDDPALPGPDPATSLGMIRLVERPRR